jgi:hypothetical protein
MNSIVYSVDVKSNGMAYFTVSYNENIKTFELNLKDEGIWEGDNAYTAPDPRRHFICHEDGELIATRYNYYKLILLDWKENKKQPKVFHRVRQWEFDKWFSEQFPTSGNAKVYNKIQNFIKVK